MIKRKHNWVSLLNQFILSCSGMDFQYGSFDCCLFVCDTIEAMTGVDVAADFRGKYKSKTGAGKICKRMGGVLGIATTVFKENGLKNVAANYAGRGDIVYFEPDGSGALGLISTCGRNIVAADIAGCSFTPKKEGIVFWRIE